MSTFICSNCKKTVPHEQLAVNRMEFNDEDINVIIETKTQKVNDWSGCLICRKCQAALLAIAVGILWKGEEG